MGLIDGVDLVYERNLKNNKKRRVMEVILEATKHNDVPVNELLEKIKDEIGATTYSRKVFYMVLKRLKELGIVKVKTERDIETDKRRRVVVLTPDAFEYFLRNKVLKSLRSNQG